MLITVLLVKQVIKKIPEEGAKKDSSKQEDDTQPKGKTGNVDYRRKNLMSESLYTTFGNEISYEIPRDKLVKFLENNTINFPIRSKFRNIIQHVG